MAGRGVAAGATHVLDDELLAETVGQFLRDEARDDVGRSAGRKPDDDAHLPVRIRLRPCRRDAGQQQHGHQCHRFEIPAPVAANSSQEFQIEKRHWHHMFASALLIFEVRTEVAGRYYELRKPGH
jgi:hypothetical protein